jgi:hypothetical protein
MFCGNDVDKSSRVVSNSGAVPAELKHSYMRMLDVNQRAARRAYSLVAHWSFQRPKLSNTVSGPVGLRSSMVVLACARADCSVFRQRVQSHFFPRLA